MRPVRSLAAVAVLSLTGIMAGVATPAGAGVAAGQPAGELHPAAVQAPPAGTFSLRNYNSHYCLGITGGEDNAAAIQWNCNGAPDQTWHRGNEDGTSGYYQIINGDGECLGVYQISTAEGALVVGWQCLGTTHPDQYWAWDESSTNPGSYYLVDYNSGQVVGVLDNSKALGASIVQWPNQHTPNNQLWQASPAAAPAPAPSPSPGTDCQTWFVLGLHGINQGSESQDLTDFSNTLTAGLHAVPGTDAHYEPVAYPTFSFSGLPNSLATLEADLKHDATLWNNLMAGVNALQAKVKEIESACSDHRWISLFGYSEGAWVINVWLMDHQNEASVIRDVVLLGDPCYNDGTGALGLAAIAAKVVPGICSSSYPPAINPQAQVDVDCRTNDPVCGLGYETGNYTGAAYVAAAVRQLYDASQCLKTSCQHVHYTDGGNDVAAAQWLIEAMVD